jgi:hypothetical protein
MEPATTFKISPACGLRDDNIEVGLRDDNIEVGLRDGKIMGAPRA